MFVKLMGIKRSLFNSKAIKLILKKQIKNSHLSLAKLHVWTEAMLNRKKGI